MAVWRGGGHVYVKGALEAVAPLCGELLDDHAQTAEAMARRGLRVLAVAVGTRDDERELVMVGLIGLADAPRTEAIEAVIAELLAKGITADELERVKNRLIADAVFAQDSQASLARWFGVALTTGSSVESVNSWTDRIRDVDADAVLAAAKTWLDQRRSVTGYLIKDNQKPGEKRS